MRELEGCGHNPVTKKGWSIMTRYEIAKRAYDRNEIGADTMAAMKACEFSDESIKHKLAIASIDLDLAGQLLSSPNPKMIGKTWEQIMK